MIAEAGIALAAGTLTPGEHLPVRVPEPAIVLERLAATPERAPADLVRGIELVTAALAAAEQAGEPRYAATFHEVLAQLAAWQDEPDALAAHLDAARACYLEAGEPWRAAVPEGMLGHLALQGGDPQAAETRVRPGLRLARQAPARTIRTTLIPHLSYPIADSVNGTLYLPYRGEGSIL